MTNKGQKPLLRVRKMVLFKIWPQILKALIFLLWKMALFFNFGQNSEKRFFCPKKHVLAILGGFRPYDMSFLWSQSSGFEPNFQNLVRKPIFGPTTPVRLATLEKHQNWPKSAVFGFITLQIGSYAKNSHKFCLSWVSGHSGAKSIRKNSNFDFSHFRLIFQKKISGTPKSTFLGSDSWLDDFSMKF